MTIHFGRNENLTLAGLEPAIPWFVVRCLIRWATGPFKGVVTEQESGLDYPCLGMLSRNVTCYCPSTFTEANKKDSLGSTEIWTRIAGFRVLSANHYTIEPQIYRVTQKKVYLFWGFQGEHGCFQNSEINISLYYRWKIWLFLTNTFKDFIFRKMIFVIAQNFAQLCNYKYLFL